MADNLINGVTQVGADKKSGGTIFPESKSPFSSDIDRLISKLQEMEGVFVDAQGKIVGNRDKKPKEKSEVKDLTQPAPLSFIIPTGFIILHNDLKDILKVLKNTSGEKVNASWEGVALEGVEAAKVLGITGIAAGVLKQWTQGMTLNEIFDSITGFASNAIDLLPKAGRAIGEAVQNMGGSVALLFSDIKSLSSDEDIKKIHKSSQANYLVAYYNKMVEELGFSLEWEIGPDGIPTITGLKSTGTGTWSDIRLSDYIWETGTEALGHILTGGVGLGIEAITGSVVDAISDNLPKAIGSYNLLTDEYAKNVMSQMSGLYAKASMASLIRGFGYEVTDFDNYKLEKINGFSFEQIENKVKEGIGHLLTGGVGLGIEAITGSLSDSISKNASKLIASGDLLTDEYSKSVMSKMSGLYAKASMASLIRSFGYEVTDFDNYKIEKINGFSFEQLEGKTKEVIGHVLTDGIGLGAEAIAGSLTNITTNLMGSLAAISQMEDNEELKKSITPLLTGYATILVKDMISEMGYDIDPKTGEVKNKEKGILSSLWDGAKELLKEAGKTVASPLVGLVESFNKADLTTVATSKIMDMLSDSISISNDVVSNYQDSISSFIGNVSKDIKSITLDRKYLNDIKESFVYNFSNKIKEVSNSIDLDFHASMSEDISIASSKIMGNKGTTLDDINSKLDSLNENLKDISTYTGASLGTAGNILNKMPPFIPVPTSGGSSVVSEMDMPRTGS